MAIVHCSRCARVVEAGVLCPVCGSPLPNPSHPAEATRLIKYLLVCVVIVLGIVSFLLFANRLFTFKGIIVLSFSLTIVLGIGAFVFRQLRGTPQGKDSIISRRSLTIGGSKLDVYATRAEMFVGQMGYQVFNSWYTHNLSDYYDVRPSSTFLYVEVRVMNRDKKQRTIPPFKLIDQYDIIYAPCCNSPWSAEEGFGNRIDFINPGEEKRVYVVFDVPRSFVDVLFNVTRNLTYQLLVEGGFWRQALIDLEPAIKD
jgi:hypothetical protein